jgi:MoxR-like ATPase
LPVRAEPVGLSGDDAHAVDQLRAAAERIAEECGKVIVGQKDVMELLLVALLAQGHALLVGVPGLAKTLMIRTLADSMNLSFNRVQFTPDLIPSDITGHADDRGGPGDAPRRRSSSSTGPLFANVVLADEVNRTPPKTQSRAAGGDAGEAGDGRRRAAPAARPVLRAGDAEPDRAGGTYPLPRRSRTGSCSR